MKMIYGYCRISTVKQNIERQVRNILELYSMAHIIREVYTRTTLDRKEWKKLFAIVKKGDIIVFDSVSRMSGNADEGVEAYKELFNRGVTLIFIKEPHINTEVYREAMTKQIAMTGSNIDFILEGINNYILAVAEEQIRLAFEQSEKEVTDLHQRTKEGIETARLNGKQIGQKKGAKLTTKKEIKAKEIIMKHSVDFNGTLKDDEVMLLAKISRNSYYKYKKELRGVA